MPLVLSSYKLRFGTHVPMVLVEKQANYFLGMHILLTKVLKKFKNPQCTKFMKSTHNFLSTLQFLVRKS